ncbi:DNA topoisomerase 2 isoform X2 [Tanacetum coccineum]
MFERVEETQWIWKDDRMIKTPITYVPFFYDIFDRILVNAADRKQRVKEIEVKINATDNLISIWSDGESVPDVGPYHSYFSEYKIESTNGHHRIKKVKERIFKKKAKNKQSRARDGKDQVKSKSKSESQPRQSLKSTK